MKVLFLTSPKTFHVHGGLSRQLHQTKNALESLGHTIEVVTSINDQVHPVDLVHLFGASPDLESDVSAALSQGTPVIVSTVMFSNRSARMLRRAIKVQKVTRYFGWTYKPDLNAKYRICHLASHLAPNTEAEARLIHQAFEIATEKITVIPNGVDVQRFKHSTEELAIEHLGFNGYLLYTGDLEAPRKNVQKLLQVYKESQSRLNWPPLVLVGRLRQDHPLHSRIHADPMIHWIDALAPDNPLIDSLYRAAKAFVLPSQFETPGIAAMEAGLSNCSIAITQAGGTQEVFGPNVHYLDPYNNESMSQAIDNALSSPPSKALVTKLQVLDWSEVGAQTERMYLEILGRTQA